MTLSTLTRGTSNDSARRSFESELNGMQYPRALTSPQGRGRDYRGNVFVAPMSRAPIRQALPPEAEVAEPEVARPGMLSRVFWSLRRGAPAPKKLRLAETVALGEKRFVAIIHAEGRKYLVGGGAAGVALLTRLDEPNQSSDTHSILLGLPEAAR